MQFVNGAQVIPLMRQLHEWDEEAQYNARFVHTVVCPTLNPNASDLFMT